MVCYRLPRPRGGETPCPPAPSTLTPRFAASKPSTSIRVRPKPSLPRFVVGKATLPRKAISPAYAPRLPAYAARLRLCDGSSAFRAQSLSPLSPSLPPGCFDLPPGPMSELSGFSTVFLAREGMRSPRSPSSWSPPHVPRPCGDDPRLAKPSSDYPGPASGGVSVMFPAMTRSFTTGAPARKPAARRRHASSRDPRIE